MDKKAEIKKHVLDLLEASYEAMKLQVDKALNCSAIDAESWSPDKAPMRIPKVITAAILERETEQYQGRGTSFERQIKKEVKNVRYFI